MFFAAFADSRSELAVVVVVVVVVVVKDSLS